MRRALVAGNWKMNGSQAGITELMSGLLPSLRDGVNGVDVVICPPFPYLSQVNEAARGTELIVGAQNVSAESGGAYTGEVSADMLTDFRVRYVIVGHSERRQLFAEDDALVASKCAAVLAAGMMPMVCVGETREQRDAGDAEAIVARQLDAVLQVCGIQGFAQMVVAYEPVWAIGTGLSASAEQAQAMHAFIRGQLAAADDEIAARTQIVYGGSVTPQNAESLFACADIDGGLVGGASLNAHSFIEICKSVS